MNRQAIFRRGWVAALLISFSTSIAACGGAGEEVTGADESALMPPRPGKPGEKEKKEQEQADRKAREEKLKEKERDAWKIESRTERLKALREVQQERAKLMNEYLEADRIADADSLGRELDRLDVAMTDQAKKLVAELMNGRLGREIVANGTVTVAELERALQSRLARGEGRILWSGTLAEFFGGDPKDVSSANADNIRVEILYNPADPTKPIAVVRSRYDVPTHPMNDRWRDAFLYDISKGTPLEGVITVAVNLPKEGSAIFAVWPGFRATKKGKPDGMSDGEWALHRARTDLFEWFIGQKDNHDGNDGLRTNPDGSRSSVLIDLGATLQSKADLNRDPPVVSDAVLNDPALREKLQKDIDGLEKFAGRDPRDIVLEGCYQKQPDGSYRNKYDGSTFKPADGKNPRDYVDPGLTSKIERMQARARELVAQWKEAIKKLNDAKKPVTEINMTDVIK